jgi:HlyD family secretion protein
MKQSEKAINESLLKFDGDTTYVEVETSPQTYEKRIIKTGLSDGLVIEVLEGLQESDKIKAAAR